VPEGSADHVGGSRCDVTSGVGWAQAAGLTSVGPFHCNQECP
jgi:hypothetical protein